MNSSVISAAVGNEPTRASAQGHFASLLPSQTYSHNTTGRQALHSRVASTDDQDIFAPQPVIQNKTDAPTVASYTSFPAGCQPPSAAAATASIQPPSHLEASPSQQRKRPLSRGGPDPARRPRPPPLSSKSSSAVPTLSTTSVSASTPSSPAPKSPAAETSPRGWLTRSITATSTATLKAPQTAADSLRQSIMFG
ncbi:Hypothetical protein D9617_6g094890 [Elsinoe fawcettii]|nr:Hypothetical protein D9617_6g094890 [Elsinoe fawcettii]